MVYITISSTDNRDENKVTELPVILPLFLFICYADVQKGARAREYEGAIEWLCQAGLVHRVSAIETPRLPLSAYKKDNAFKLYLNDVGLLGRKFDLDATTILMGDNLFTEFKGVMAENYVLQALVR